MGSKTYAKTAERGRLRHIIDANLHREDITQYAASIAYYAMMSLFPLLLVIANLIPYLPIDLTDLLTNLNTILPKEIFSIIAPILSYYMSGSSTGALSAGFLTALWSSSNLIHSLMRVLNATYRVDDIDEHHLSARLFSPLVMLALLFLLTALVFVFVYGEKILIFLANFFKLKPDFVSVFAMLRQPALLLVVFLLLVATYYLVPNHQLKIREGVPGAAFASLALLLVSELFTQIIHISAAGKISNATLGQAIVLMLYMYVTAILILLGGAINSIVYEYRHGVSVRQAKLSEQTRKKDRHRPGQKESVRLAVDPQTNTSDPSAKG